MTLIRVECNNGLFAPWYYHGMRKPNYLCRIISCLCSTMILGNLYIDLYFCIDVYVSSSSIILDIFLFLLKIDHDDYKLNMRLQIQKWL